jgi:hypothetical protein
MQAIQSVTVWTELLAEYCEYPEADFLDEIQTKVYRVFLLAFLFTCTALPWNFYFYKLTQPLTVSTVQLLYTVKEKGGKPDRKPYPRPYGLRNPYRNLKKYENSEDYAQKPQQNCTFMNSVSNQSAASGLASLTNNRVESQENVVVNSWILAYLLSRPSIFIIIILAKPVLRLVFCQWYHSR